MADKKKADSDIKKKIEKDINKKVNNSKKKAKKNIKKNVKKELKKPKTLKIIFFTVIAIILILAISMGVIYFVSPVLFDKIIGFFRGNSNIITDPSGQLTVNYLDVGQGDCIIIQLPDGKNMIIDAGGSTNSSGIKCKDKIIGSDTVEGAIDQLGIKTFDYLMLTHSDKDHVDYMDDVLRKYTVKEIYRPAYNSKSENKPNRSTVTTVVYDDFVLAVADEVRDEGAVVKENIGKMQIGDEAAGYIMDIYCVDESVYNAGSSVDAYESNKVSPICVLNYAGRRMVFTGDAEGEEAKSKNNAEHIFMDKLGRPIDCDVLKVGHHGSEVSTSQDFLEFIDVEYAVISVGIDNSYEHPRPELMERLNNYRDLIPDNDYNGIKEIYRTDKNGDVKLIVKGTGEIAFNTLNAAA